MLDVLQAMGYGGSREDAAERLGRSGDGGVDGVIREDKLGLDLIYVQAKSWSNTVGRPEIQRFVGALQGQRASKGVFKDVHRPPNVDANPAHARVRLGAVIAAERHRLGGARRKALQALGDLWEATDALTQRQGTEREGA